MFKNILIQLDMLNHYYSDFFVKFVSNIIYFFLQIVVFQNVKCYL